MSPRNMSLGQLLPWQMSLWQLPANKDDPRKLPKKVGQNQRETVGIFIPLTFWHLWWRMQGHFVSYPTKVMKSWVLVELMVVWILTTCLQPVVKILILTRLILFVPKPIKIKRLLSNLGLIKTRIVNFKLSQPQLKLNSKVGFDIKMTLDHNNNRNHNNNNNFLGLWLNWTQSSLVLVLSSARDNRVKELSEWGGDDLLALEGY